MKIAKHICFYYKEDRIRYLNQLIDAASEYDDEVDIFIHTHNHAKWLSEKIHRHDNLNIKIVKHDLKCHPFFLTWKPRILMREQIKEDNYDIYMYVEDDILVSNDSIKYWKKYFADFYEKQINLGFIRTETNSSGKEFWTDASSNNYKHMIIENNILDLGIISYSAFWIYDKELTGRMLDVIARPDKVSYCRERAAFGANLHAYDKSAEKIFDKTCIPLENNQLPKSCQVYHLPNNYIGINSMYCKLEIKNIISTAMGRV